ncbi:MAG TPA: T9SS type A sorting domain-containing protein [Saprospiraceae bacterium]|nr:T9SS type A sorting domain-containing protein [Saprospiraceae bacterium]
MKIQNFSQFYSDLALKFNLNVGMPNYYKCIYFFICVSLFSRGYAQLTCNSPTNRILSGLINTPLIANGEVIELQGIVTLNKGANLTGCLVKAQPGAKLICKSTILSANSYYFSNTNFLSCNGSWIGIEINPKSYAYFSNHCKVSKANIGVKAKSVSFLSFEDSDFIDNIVGISMEGYAVLMNLNGCLFDRTTVLSGSIGLELNGAKQLTRIGNSGNSSIKNTFNNLGIGVGSQFSNFEISNSVFKNCDYGVKVSNGDWSSTIPYLAKIEGYGKTGEHIFIDNLVSDVECKGPVYLELTDCRHRRSHLGNNALDFYSAVNVNSNNLGTIRIQNNRFETSGLLDSQFHGNNDLIFIGVCQTTDIDIINNDHLDQGSRDFYTIDMWNTTASGNFITVSNNKVQSLTSQFLGFTFLNCENLLLEGNNSIRISPFGVLNPFIKLTDCNKVIARYNDVSDYKTLNADHFGIYVQNTENAFLCQNILNQVGHGIVASGMCPNLQVVDNRMNNTYRGLWYQNGTIANITNKHRINLFSGPSSIYHAQHDGSTYRSNQYLVRNDNDYGWGSFPYKPPTITPGNQQWFKYPLDGAPNGCVLSTNQMDKYFQPYVDTSFTNHLTEGQLWDGLTDFYLYSKYHTDPSNNSLELQALYQSLNNTNLSKFADIRELIKAYSQISNQYFSALESKQSEIEQIQDEIYQVHLEMDSLPIIDSSLVWFDLLDSLGVVLDIKYGEFGNIMNTINAEQAAKLGAIDGLNNVITPISSYEINLKFLYSMWSKNVNHTPYTNTEVLEIKQLAERCLHTVGDQVVFAQSLLPIDQKFDRTTDMFCTNISQTSSILLDTKESQKSRILSSHNVFSIETSADSFEMFDLAGKRVIYDNIPDSEINVNLNSFSSGIYILKLNYGSQSEFHKLVKY